MNRETPMPRAVWIGLSSLGIWLTLLGCGSSRHPESYSAPDVDVLTQASAAATLNIAHPPPGDAEERAPEPVSPPPQSSSHAGVPPEILRFSWRPTKAPAGPYSFKEAADRHALVIFPGAQNQEHLTVIVGFHGQPKRGKPPREYAFEPTVIDTASRAIAQGAAPPAVLVLPTFKFRGRNWPGFDAKAFRAEIERILANKGMTPTRWLVFGHSGAAGCGGRGLNEVDGMRPDAVGFFDTCLGLGWSRQLQALRTLKIPSVSIHSVETAGFRPRQRPEYQHLFDFGRAYEPAGLSPVSCPSETPGAKLREQNFRCAASKDGFAEGYVVDSGTGKEAHEALLPLALQYFLERFASP